LLEHTYNIEEAKSHLERAVSYFFAVIALLIILIRSYYYKMYQVVDEENEWRVGKGEVLRDFT
jgi:hypothetical protein